MSNGHRFCIVIASLFCTVVLPAQTAQPTSSGPRLQLLSLKYEITPSVGTVSTSHSEECTRYSSSFSAYPAPDLGQRYPFGIG